MAVPKKKTSRSRRDKRRTHYKLKEPGLAPCPRCHEPKMPHRACPSCGFYRGREAVSVEE